MATIVNNPAFSIVFATGATNTGRLHYDDVFDAFKKLVEKYNPGKTVTVVQEGEGAKITVT